MGKLKNILFLITFLSAFLLPGCGELSLKQAPFVKPGVFKGLIIFISDRGAAGREIYTVNADSTNLSVISVDNYDNYATPTFSPDGKKIAFEGNDGIYISNIDGSNKKLQISGGPTDLCEEPKWVDEKTIFYAKLKGANKCFSIYRYDFTTSKEQKVLDYAGSFTFSVSFNQRLLVYESPSDYPDIVLKDLKTGEIFNLTNGKGKFVSRRPSLSPDGKKIAFTSNRNGNMEIYIMDRNGQNVKRITYNKWPEDYPTWSPGGTKLVYSSHRHGDPFGGAELFIIDLKDMKEGQLTEVVKLKSGIFSSDIQPSWTK